MILAASFWEPAELGRFRGSSAAPLGDRRAAAGPGLAGPAALGQGHEVSAQFMNAVGVIVQIAGQCVITRVYFSKMP
jgi:hypothetical protein